MRIKRAIQVPGLEKVVMTERVGAPVNKSLLKAEGEPDIEVITMPLWKQVAVRAARTFIQSFIGFVATLSSGLAQGAANTVGAALVLPPGETLAMYYLAVLLSIPPVIFSLAHNTAEILARWDVTVPQIRA